MAAAPLIGGWGYPGYGGFGGYGGGYGSSLYKREANGGKPNSFKTKTS